MTYKRFQNIESLRRYQDALRTGDPDRQLADGGDIEVVSWAIERIEELDGLVRNLLESLEGAELDCDGLADKCSKLEAKLAQVEWRTPEAGVYPEGTLLIQVDLSSGEKDTALVYISDDTETLIIADGYGDVWTNFEWQDVSRYIPLQALEQDDAE